MEISLNARQTQVLYLSDNKNIRIEGQAGSGKSIVALYRAFYLASRYPEKKVLLTCFNNLLIKDIKNKFENLEKKFGERENLEIMTIYGASQKFLEICRDTFHENNLAFPYLKSDGGILPGVDPKRYKKPWIEAIYKSMLENRPSSEVIETDIQNILDEISWLQSMGINERQAYIDIERVGRSNFRVTRDKRDFIYDIYEEYLQVRRSGIHKDSRGRPIKRYYDFDDIGAFGNEIAAQIKSLGFAYNEKLYDIVIIDEYQDFSTDMFYSVRNLLKEEGHYELVGDPEQSIFGNRVSWKSIGIDAAKMKKYDLKTNYRNTKEIYKVAINFYAQKDLNYYTPRTGAKPRIAEFRSIEDEVTYIAHLSMEYDSENEDYMIIYDDKIYDDKIKEINKNAKTESINRVKGLEFDTVIVPGFSNEKLERASADENTSSNLKNKAYVALTRASDNLIMTSPSPLISLIDREDVDAIEL